MATTVTCEPSLWPQNFADSRTFRYTFVVASALYIVEGTRGGPWCGVGREVYVDRAEELYQELIAPIEDRMIATVTRIVRDPDDAADAFQETLAIVWKKLSKISRHPNPHAYILRVCVSRSYEALRKRMRRREVPLKAPERISLVAVGEHLPANPEAAAVIRRAISLLPHKQAQAVLLRVMDGASYEAIGQILGCSKATARSHLSKGKARLRKVLSELGVT